MPFVHWDTLHSVSRRQSALELFLDGSVPTSVRQTYDNAASDPIMRYTNYSITSQRSLHSPRTLDQYQYPSITLSIDRLRNQVVPRQTCTSASGTRVLVVHQLWLIVPNERRFREF